MYTLSNVVTFEGTCLISGKASKLEILPAKLNTGINFVNVQTNEKLSALVDNVIDTSHCVVIGKPPYYVKLIEHLMSAFALTRLTDVEVLIYGDEIPIGDGSAKTFYDLFKNKLKIIECPDEFYTISTPTYFNTRHTTISALPSDHFKITYAVNYINSPFSYSWYNWDKHKNEIDDLTNCRTFGYVKDLPEYQSKGMALGVTLDNTIGLNNDGTLTTELRYNNEPIRHKVLDLVGDLYLSGINPLNLNIHIIAIECGHYQHIELTKILKKQLILQLPEEQCRI